LPLPSQLGRACRGPGARPSPPPERSPGPQNLGCLLPEQVGARSVRPGTRFVPVRALRQRRHGTSALAASMMMRAPSVGRTNLLRTLARDQYRYRRRHGWRPRSPEPRSRGAAMCHSPGLGCEVDQTAPRSAREELRGDGAGTSPRAVVAGMSAARELAGETSYMPPIADRADRRKEGGQLSTLHKAPGSSPRRCPALPDK
jgi:hypothetical protein